MASTQAPKHPAAKVYCFLHIRHVSGCLLGRHAKTTLLEPGPAVGRPGASNVGLHVVAQLLELAVVDDAAVPELLQLRELVDNLRGRPLAA